jgi:hypothetical protein
MSLLNQLNPQEKVRTLNEYRRLIKAKFPRFDSIRDDEKSQFLIDHEEALGECMTQAIETVSPYVLVRTTQRTDSQLAGATGCIADSSFRTDSAEPTLTRLDAALYEKGAALAYSGQSIGNLTREDCIAIDYYNDNRPGAAKQARAKGSTDAMATAPCSRADASTSPSMARRKNAKLPGMDSPFTSGGEPIQKATAPISSMERRKNAKFPGMN